MMILMAHTQHGHMHVYTEAEAVANEKNGWKRENETTKKVVAETQKILKIPDAVEEIITATNIIERYEAKFGKKPHHRLSQSKIEAALKELKE